MSRPAHRKSPQEEIAEMFDIKLEPEPQEPEPAAAVEPEEPEAQAPAEPVSAEPPSDGQGEEGAPAEAGQPDREKALEAEIRRLRQENRRYKSAEMLRVAPSPVAVPPTPAQPPKPKGVAVKVSEDGSQVFADPDELERFVAERAERIVESKLKPTPEQLRAMEHHQAIARFAAEDDAARTVIGMVPNVNAFLFEALQGEIQAAGRMPQSIPETVAMLEDSGALEKLREYSPEFAEHIEDFLDSQVGDDLRAHRVVLKAIARDIRRSSGGGGSSGAPAQPALSTPTLPARPQLADVSKGPRALAAKGGGRSQGSTPDEREFADLDSEMRRDWLGWVTKKEKQARYDFLGAKLRKPGFV